MVDLRELAPALAACVVALVFAVAAFTNSGGRRGKGFAVDDGALYTALLDDDEAKVADDGAADGPYVVPSRSRLACRQAAYYVAGAWNAVAGAWFARSGTLDAAAAAPLVVALAWLLVSACVAHHDDSILSFGIHFKPDGDMHAQDAAAAAMTRCLIKAGVRNAADIDSAFQGACGEYGLCRSILGPLLEAGADLDAGIRKHLALTEIAHRSSFTSVTHYLLKVKKAGGYENLVATYRRVLTAPESALAKFIEFRLGRAAPHDVVAKVLEFWKPPGGP